MIGHQDQHDEIIHNTRPCAQTIRILKQMGMGSKQKLGR